MFENNRSFSQFNSSWRSIGQINRLHWYLGRKSELIQGGHSRWDDVRFILFSNGLSHFIHGRELGTKFSLLGIQIDTLRYADDKTAFGKPRQCPCNDRIIMQIRKVSCRIKLVCSVSENDIFNLL